MRIVFVTYGLGAGGAERVLLTIAGAWADRGCDTQIITYEAAAPFYPVHPQIKLISLGFGGGSRGPISALLNMQQRIRALRGAIRAVGPDVVVSFQYLVNIETQMAVSRLDVPLIASERTDPRMKHVGAPRRWLRRRAYRRVDVLVAQTQRALDYFSSDIRERGVVIPNPVAQLHAQSGPPELHLAQPTVLAIGRLLPQKGFDVLLQAWAKIATRHPKWTLNVLGEGPSRSDLEQQRDALGLVGRAHFPGVVKQVAPILRQADLFVLSSRFEGFPNALCEAMAHGLPVISTDCPSGPREIIRDGIDGLLAPVEDPAGLAKVMERMIVDQPLRSALAREAPRVSERFSNERVIAMWDDVIERATGRRPMGLSTDVSSRRAA